MIAGGFGAESNYVTANVPVTETRRVWRDVLTWLLSPVGAVLDPFCYENGREDRQKTTESSARDRSDLTMTPTRISLKKQKRGLQFRKPRLRFCCAL
jgi:hypothetical protein